METIRTHRVGTITTGFILIAFGVMFLLHLFFGAVSYEMIFRLWPLILIGLGSEVLLSNFAKDTIVYDKGAIALMIVIAFFAMGMASVDVIMQNITL